MPVHFSIYYRDPQVGNDLKEAVKNFGGGDLIDFNDVANLPTEGLDQIDFILIQYDEKNPDLDQWIEAHSQKAKPAIFIYVTKLSENILLKAVRLGAKDCFEIPLNEQLFREAVERLLARATIVPHPGGEAKIITVMGSKGGVGTTFLTSNIGFLMAKERRGKVLLVDLDMPYSELSLFFDVKSPHSLFDAVENLDHLSGPYLHSLLHPLNDSLYLLPGPSDIAQTEAITPDHIAKILLEAKKLPDIRWILIDACRQLNEINLMALEICNQLELVISPVISSLTDAKKILELLSTMEFKNLPINIWLNTYTKDVNLKDLSMFLGKEISGTVRSDSDGVLKSINAGRLLAETSPSRPIIKDVRAIAQKIINEEQAPKTGWLKRLFRLGK